MRLYLTFVAVLLATTLFNAAWAQRTVNGTVSGQSDGAPLSGATVVVKGLQIGTFTDDEGKFSLSVPSGANALIVSYLGYETQEVLLDGQTTLNIMLAPGDVTTDEVVVTAFGVSKEKKSLGYAIQELGGGQLAETRRVNLVDAMQGRVPGAIITSAGGAPGAGSSIILRGITSLDPSRSNQPLFVIDGVPIDNSTVAGNMLPSSGSNSPGSSEQASFSNRALDLNPNDIESVSILKGAAAAALYGLRAANGAIIITTKRGAPGRGRINFTSTLGFDELATQPVYQARYREGRFGRIRFNSDGSPLRFQQFGPLSGPNTPFFDNIDSLFQTGIRTENNLTFSGGGDKSTYYVGLSYLDQKGMIPTSYWNRLGGRFNGTYRLNKRLQVGYNLNYTRSGGNRPHSGDKSILSSLSYMSPTFSINDYVNPDGSQRDFSAGVIDNPRYVAEFSKFEDNVDRFLGSVNLNYDFSDWLKLSYRAGTDVYADNRLRTVPDGMDVSFQVGGFMIDERIKYREYNSTLLLTAAKNLSDKFSASLTLGHDLNERRFNSITTRGERFIQPNFYTINNTTNIFTTAGGSLRRLVGLLADARLQYDWIYLNLTARNDWSSTLPKDNRSFFYPSASLSMVLSDALKLSSSSKLTFAKLRFAAGLVGDDADPYLIGAYYSVAPNFPFGGVSGLRANTLNADPNLRPEFTRSLEAGLEARFFKNRLGFDLTLFEQRTYDQILRLPVSNTTGLSQYVTNAGEISNKGIEAMVFATPVKSKNFSWDINLNWGRTRGEVIELADGIEEVIIFADPGSGVLTKLVPGGRVGDMYGFNFKRRGNSMLIGTDGFPSLDDTVSLAGNALPDWIGGLNNAFTFRGFNLSFFWEWRHGGDVIDMGRRNGIRNGVLDETERRHMEVVFKGVKADGTTNNTPVVIDGENLYRNFFRYNGAADILVEDASWVRLRNLSIGYTAPKKWLENSDFIRQASFTLTGINLFLNTPFRGYDPEALYFGSGSNAFGFTGLVIPPARSILATLNLGF